MDYDKENDTPISRLVIWCVKRGHGDEIGMLCNVSRGGRDEREKGTMSWDMHVYTPGGQLAPILS